MSIHNKADQRVVCEHQRAGRVNRADGVWITADTAKHVKLFE